MAAAGLAIQSFYVRLLYYEEECELHARVPCMRHEQHRVRAADERVPVVQRVANSVHRVREQLEDAIERQSCISLRKKKSPQYQQYSPMQR